LVIRDFRGEGGGGDVALGGDAEVDVLSSAGGGEGGGVPGRRR
jgi:hypothetical protein